MSEPSLLPPNATAAERAIESAVIERVPAPIVALWNPHTCPASLLPWLAWALSIDAWKDYWPIEVKRARVAAAINIQRRKGTVQSVRDVVASFRGDVLLREWWETTPPGVPHTFEVVLTAGVAATADFLGDIAAEVTRTKPVRSHFTLTQGFAAQAKIAVVVVAMPAVYSRLNLSEAP